MCCRYFVHSIFAMQKLRAAQAYPLTFSKSQSPCRGVLSCLILSLLSCKTHFTSLMQRPIANIIFVLLHRQPKASELASVEIEFDRNGDVSTRISIICFVVYDEAGSCKNVAHGAAHEARGDAPPKLAKQFLDLSPETGGLVVQGGQISPVSRDLPLQRSEALPQLLRFLVQISDAGLRPDLGDDLRLVERSERLEAEIFVARRRRGARRVVGEGRGRVVRDAQVDPRRLGGSSRTASGPLLGTSGIRSATVDLVLLERGERGEEGGAGPREEDGGSGVRIH